MSRPRLRWSLIALFAFFVSAAVPARGGTPVTDASADDPSGAPAMHELRAPAPVAIPAGLDDMLQPIRDPSPGPLRPDVSDLARASREAAAPAVPLWKRLAELDAAQRANARIELHPLDASIEAGALAQAVPASWEAREYDVAIDALRAFEEAGGVCALGIAWKEPVPANVMREGPDVRVGTRSLAQSTWLDYYRANGQLLAVARWGNTTGDAQWSIMKSTNQGGSWTETYVFFVINGLVDVSAALVDQYLYAGWITSAVPNAVNVRRFIALTGFTDGTYVPRTVLGTGTTEFTEVVLASNVVDFDNRIYVLALEADGSLRYTWDVGTDGTTFAEVATGIADASHGLDASWNNGTACGDYLFVTYVATDDTIQVASHSNVSGWTVRGLVSSSVANRPVSVSVHDGLVICAYEWPYTEGHGVRYSISYDCGDSWSYGSLAIPDGVAVTGYFAPDVDANNPYGTAVVYHAEAGDRDTVYYHYRWGFAPGTWRARMPFNQYDVLTGTESTIAPLPRYAAHTMSHAGIYLTAERIPYFDYPGMFVLGSPAAAPADGALRLASGNPAHGASRFELVMPRAARATVRVYDVAGALVRELADREFAAGTHVLEWNGANQAGASAGPGVYFLRASTGRGQLDARLVVLR